MPSGYTDKRVEELVRMKPALEKAFKFIVGYNNELSRKNDFLMNKVGGQNE